MQQLNNKVLKNNSLNQVKNIWTLDTERTVLQNLIYFHKSCKLIRFFRENWFGEKHRSMKFIKYFKCTEVVYGSQELNVLSHPGSYWWSEYYSQKLLSKLDHLMTCCYSQCRNTCKEESEQQLFLELKYFCSVLRIFAVRLGFCSKLSAGCNSVLWKK